MYPHFESQYSKAYSLFDYQFHILDCIGRGSNEVASHFECYQRIVCHVEKSEMLCWAG